MFGGNGAEAFKDIEFRKPKKDGTPGPIVKKVQIMEKSNLSVPVHGGRGVADNETMVRVDVFKVEGEGYYWVPIYVADTLKPKLPNKASVANKPYSEWKEMRDEDFIFSLYPNDIIKIRAKKSLSFKTVNKNSTLPPEKIDNDCLVYFISGGISVASFTVITHDKTYTVASLGVKTLESLEKNQVDVLGNFRHRFQFIDDAVQAGIQANSQGQVGIAGRIGGAQLDAGALPSGGGDADQRGTVGSGPGDIAASFVTGHQTLVGVDQGVGDGGHAADMGQGAGDEVQGVFGEAVQAVLVVEDIGTVLEEGHIDMHAGTVDAEDRLGHEGRVQAVALGNGLDDQLEGHDVVGSL